MRKKISFYEKFIKAFKLGNKKEIILLINRAEFDGGGTDVDAKNENGRTILHAAIEYRDIKAVGLLIDKGADIDA